MFHKKRCQTNKILLAHETLIIGHPKLFNRHLYLVIWSLEANGQLSKLTVTLKVFASDDESCVFEYEKTNILLDVMLLLDRPTLSTWGFHC